MMRRVASVLGAVPDFAIAGAALLTWVNPSLLGEEKVAWFLGLMLLEFIVVHSSAFLGTVAFGPGSRAGKLGKSVGLSLFYSVFAAGFAASMRDPWPLYAFWGLTANRLLSLMLGAAPAHHEKEFAQMGWGASVVFYLLAAFVTVLLPLPALGIAREMLGVVGENATGTWVRDPHRVVAFAFLYFGAQGVFGRFAGRSLGGAPTRREA